MELKYCLYARKSTESDERQAMSIGSQINEMTTLAQREGLSIVEVKQESFSAKQSGSRPVFNEMLLAIRNSEFDAILTWAPDRLARNAGDLGSLVDLMDAGKLQRIRTFGQSFENNPNEKFLLMILGSQAKLENDNRSINVKRGLRAKCELGWRPGMPPLGYFTRGATGNGRDVIVDEERAPYIKKMFEMSAAGKSGRYIQRWLQSKNVQTRGDKAIPLSAIYRILKNPYYYGEFEYPAKSGNWYKGNHEALVTRELFDEVQKALIVPPKAKWGTKDFPFKGFIKCYTCGSSLVGEQKLRYNKNGTYRKYIYYHCSRQVDRNCREPYVSEHHVINQLYSMRERLIPELKTLEVGLRREIEKIADIQNCSLPAAYQSYLRYVLYRGTQFERIRFIRNVVVSLRLHHKKLQISVSPN